MSLWKWLKQRLGIRETPARESSAPVQSLQAPASPAPVLRAQVAVAMKPAAPVPRTAVELPADLLQFSSHPKGGAATDVVVGFDFGTSSVKVAMQTPYSLGGRTVIIDFDKLGHESCTYLLPAAVYRRDSGLWSLTLNGHAEQRRHLKLPLLGEIRNGQVPDQESTAWAVAFVALALREARRVFLRTQANTHNRARLRWAMNLGIPSAGYDDAGIRGRFLEVGRAAWLASLHPEVTSSTVGAAIAASKTSTDGEIPIAVVPEVAAEMVGYARSRYRRPGLHAVVDIGASTLDICGIDLFANDGDDTYELLTADVRDLGFLELHVRRMKAAEHKAPFDAVPADIVAPLTGFAGVSDEVRIKLQRSDRHYIDEAAAVMVRTLAWLRKKRAPNASAWQKGLPLFVTGGGMGSEVANCIIQLADKRAKSMWDNYRGLVRQPLPMDVAGPDGDRAASSLSRMAVAYGLSFPEINIGTIVPPREIPDVVPEPMRRREWQRAYVGKDCV